MFTQECMKGIAGIDETVAKQLTEGGEGIQCNFWRNTGVRPAPLDTRVMLTEDNLVRHLHDYDSYGRETPFISLSAGAVDRQAAMRTNVVNPAEETAALFAVDFGREPEGFIFQCWLVVALNPAVSIEGVAEEVRELHTYTRFSLYQLEGEVTAKIHIPANQIKSYRRCTADRTTGRLRFDFGTPVQNSRYDAPEVLMNRRGLF